MPELAAATTVESTTEIVSDVTAAPLAERSSYYYAHTQRGADDGVLQFEPPKKLEAKPSSPTESESDPKSESSQNQQTSANSVPAGVSKWNTGSYHWEETDLKQSFTQLLAQHAATVQLPGKKVTVQCAKVQCDGMIFSNLRKGKMILGYDLTLTPHFTATFSRKDCDPVAFHGSFTVGNVCEDCSVDEWQIRDVQCEKSTAVNEATKETLPDVAVKEPGSKQRVMSATELDRTIRQQRMVSKTVEKKFVKLMVAAIDAALKEQYATESTRRLGL